MKIEEAACRPALASPRSSILGLQSSIFSPVVTDRLFQSLEVEVDDRKFCFDASTLEHKRANEKRELVYEFTNKRDDGALVFATAYKEGNKKTKLDDIIRQLHKLGVEVKEEAVERAFRVFERQSEVDYFINKNSKAFLREQFDLWLFQYVFSGESEWTEQRIKQLQVLKDIATKVIDFISQFEDELVKIWNKPKFVLNSNYVVTLDRIAAKGVGQRPQFRSDICTARHLTPPLLSSRIQLMSDPESGPLAVHSAHGRLTSTSSLWN